MFVYRNAIDFCISFCILQLCWIRLLDLTVFGLSLSGFLSIKQCLLQIETILLLPLQFRCPLFALPPWPLTPSAALRRRGESGCLCLVPTLRGTLAAFHRRACWLWACRAQSPSRYTSSTPLSWRVFVMKAGWILSSFTFSLYCTYFLLEEAQISGMFKEVEDFRKAGLGPVSTSVMYCDILLKIRFIFISFFQMLFCWNILRNPNCGRPRKLLCIWGTTWKWRRRADKGMFSGFTISIRKRSWGGALRRVSTGLRNGPAPPPRRASPLIQFSFCGFSYPWSTGVWKF